MKGFHAQRVVDDVANLVFIGDETNRMIRRINEFPSLISSGRLRNVGLSAA
ncbi:MAG TPA: hypothetical protein VF190_08040 [Rhodothermales bacterium]